MTADIRWKQRYENFSKASDLLDDVLKNGPSSLNQLEREGVIQRFEYTFELAWKTVKACLENEGVFFGRSFAKESSQVRLRLGIPI